MPLAASEIDVIVEVLVQKNPTQEALRAALQAIAPMARIAGITQGGAPLPDALGIVHHLDATAPSELLKILEYFASASLDLETVRRRYQESLRASTTPPLLERLLWRKTVVLDRGPLRDVLKTLIQTDSSNVLLVTGPSKSGKSRTRELIRRVASANGHLHAIVPNASVLGAAETVSQILVQIAPAPNPASYEVEDVASPDSHWYRAQCKRIIASALDAMARLVAKRCWIVIDAIGPNTGTVAELCDHLIQLVAPMTNGVRLVILGYPKNEAPDAIESSVEWDRLDYGMVQESDVRDYLNWLFGEVVNKPLSEAALAAELETLFANVTPQSEGFLDQIRRGLESRTRDALKGSP